MECAHEWEVCVEAELQELQERVGERAKRRVMENIRGAGVVDALIMPYRRDVVAVEVNYEARECVRDMRRHLLRNLRDLAEMCGLATSGLGLYLECERSVLASRRYTTLIIAILLDAGALYFLREPGATLIGVGKEMVTMLGSTVGGGGGAGTSDGIFNSVAMLGSKVEKIVEIARYIGSAMQVIVALVKVWVLLWFLSKLHKMLVRRNVKVQTRQVVDQLVKSLREQLATRNIPQFFKNLSDNATE